MMKRLFQVLFCFTLLAPPLFGQWLPDPAIDEKIQRGIVFIYNLEFEKADLEFSELVNIRPDQPVGYFFQAMTEWWRILIDLENESHDKKFYDMLEYVIDLCDGHLKKNPNDVTALFFKGGAIGFRGRLRANRGNWLGAAKDGVTALPIVRKAYELDQHNYDVMLGIGIYNYYADIVPKEYPLIKPLMWFFPSGDKKKGLEQLTLASQNAKYANIEASYFLMQNYFLYEKEYTAALLMSKRLHGMFPRNSVFQRYLGRCNVRLGYWAEAALVFTDVDKAYGEHRTGFSDSDGREASYYLGRFFFMGTDLDVSLKHFLRCEELSRKVDKEGNSGFRALANLYLGMIYDAQKKRELAVQQYRKVLAMKEYEISHQDARRYIQQPYAR